MTLHRSYFTEPHVTARKYENPKKGIIWGVPGFLQYEIRESPLNSTGHTWTVTRNGPRILPSSRIWIVEMYISTCWLPRGLSDAQRRGRTTHWVCRGDGGGRCPPRARTRRLARHLCRQHRSESDIFSPENQRINLLRKSNGNL